MLSCYAQDDGESVWLAVSVIPSRGKYTYTHKQAQRCRHARPHGHACAHTHTHIHTRTDLNVLTWNEASERANVVYCQWC